MASSFAESDVSGNNLIDSLKPADRRAIMPHLQLWQAAPRQVIWQAGDDIEQVYFPLDQTMASFRITLSEGRDVETALVGREGALGGIVSHGRLPAYARAVVQFPGRFARMPLPVLEQLKDENRRIANLFNRYADCLLAQIFQSTACNAAHTIEQRSAKWLISAADRMGKPELPFTHEQLGALLGVGRSYVSRTIGRFKAEGMIQTRRSSLVITDMTGLARLACDCDDNVRRHFDEVLKGVYPPEVSAK